MLEVHGGSGAGSLAGPENDGMGVPYSDHAHYRHPGAVVGSSATPPQGGAGGQGGPGEGGGVVGGEARGE